MNTLTIHKEEDRYWRDFANVMSRVSTDKQGAYCVGIVTAIAMFSRGYPNLQTMGQAARQDPKALSALILRERRAAAQQSTRAASAPQAGKDPRVGPE
jgi:hypothetical protein